jgi:hypothetical protein
MFGRNRWVGRCRGTSVKDMWGGSVVKSMWEEQVVMAMWEEQAVIYVEGTGG